MLSGSAQWETDVLMSEVPHLSSHSQHFSLRWTFPTPDSCFRALELFWIQGTAANPAACWATLSTRLGLSFLICKMDITESQSL